MAPPSPPGSARPADKSGLLDALRDLEAAKGAAGWPAEDLGGYGIGRGDAVSMRSLLTAARLRRDGRTGNMAGRPVNGRSDRI